jgi:hypothetical protein
MKNILDVIYEVNNIDSHSCDQNFTDQVGTIIQSKYGLLPNSSTECATSTTNTQLQLLITKETYEEAASVFFTFFNVTTFHTHANFCLNNDVKERLPRSTVTDSAYDRLRPFKFELGSDSSNRYQIIHYLTSFTLF